MIPEVLQVTETDAQSWMRRALCADADPDLWFPDPADEPGVRQARTEEAISICGHCPVRGECLRWAFRVRDDWAILGATTKNMRSRTRRRIARSKTLEKGG